MKPRSFELPMSGATFNRRTRQYPIPPGPPGGFISRRLVIPDDPVIIAAMVDVLAYLSLPGVWIENDNPGAPAEYDLRAWMADATLGLIEGHYMIGSVVPYVSENPPPGCIAADGSTYAAADYPLLWAVIDPGLRLSSTAFYLPDLTQRVIVGAAPGEQFQVGGADSITITVDQLPSHSHTAQPHSHTTAPHVHSEGIAIPTIINGGIEAPASASSPGVSSTGPADVIVNPETVTIDPAGGGQAVDIRQQFIRLRKAVIAQ